MAAVLSGWIGTVHAENFTGLRACFDDEGALKPGWSFTMQAPDEVGAFADIQKSVKETQEALKAMTKAGAEMTPAGYTKLSEFPPDRETLSHVCLTDSAYMIPAGETPLTIDHGFISGGACIMSGLGRPVVLRNVWLTGALEVHFGTQGYRTIVNIQPKDNAEGLPDSVFILSLVVGPKGAQYNLWGAEAVRLATYLSST